MQVTRNPDGGAAGCCRGLAAHLPPHVFKALSDPRRLSLFARLAEQRAPCTVSQMAEGSGVDLSVVSRHLAILREAGIIECAKQGKEVWCSVPTAAVAGLLRTLADALEACCSERIPAGPVPGKRLARSSKTTRRGGRRR